MTKHSVEFENIMQREVPELGLPEGIVRASLDPRVEAAAKLCINNQGYNAKLIAEAANDNGITVGYESDFAMLLAMQRRLEELNHGEA